MKTRANTAGGKKGGVGNNEKIQAMTKPGTSAVQGKAVKPSTQSFSGNGANKRKSLDPHGDMSKKAKGIYTSTSIDSSDNRSVSAPRLGNLCSMEKDMEKDRLEQMYDWFQKQRKYHRHRRRSQTPSSSYSYSRSRSRSRGSRSPSRRSHRSGTSWSSSRRSRRSHKSHRSRSSRKEHELSYNSQSLSPSQGRNIDNIIQAANPGEDTFTSGPTGLDKTDSDPLEERINVAVKECAPKPIMGPPISAKLGTLMDLYVSKPEFLKVIKISEKYPRPENVQNLTSPDVPQDVDKTIDSKIIREDKRLRINQNCTAASLASLGGALDIIREEKGKNPKLSKAGDMILDSITMLGYVHNEFSSLRLKSFKQTVNPSYVDVFSSKPEDPGMLMGKAPIAEQVKSLEELNKLKAKLKKPDPNSGGHKSRDFRKRGEYHTNQFRKPKGYTPRRRDERRKRYYSPKGGYRKQQQDNHFKAQDDKKGPPHRRN